jgi:putative flippase GtrA
MAIVAQVRSFVVIGALSTLGYVGLFEVLRVPLSAEVANAIALLVTAFANTAANRRVTFSIRGGDRLLRHHGGGLFAFAVALVVTSGALALLEVTDPAAPAMVGVAVLVAANLVASVVRFILLRRLMARGTSAIGGTQPVVDRHRPFSRVA